MKRLVGLAVAAALLARPAVAQTMAHPLTVVAAENFYGDIARQIGGSEVRVTSVLNNPNQDPHLFEVSPAIGRAVAAADIVIYSGIDYDPWMATLLQAARAGHRTTIVVADLAGKRPGDNPHIWYDPVTMLRLAQALASDFSGADPAHKTGYEQGLIRFERSMGPVLAKIAALRNTLRGTPVTATEPVFGDMFAALGMAVRDNAFQLAVMNDTEPSPRAVARFESDLRTHRVALLIYNSQASDPIAARMKEIARESGVPVVGATETEPPGTSYQDWMLGELDGVARALAPRPPTSGIPASGAPAPGAR